jgi:hypothetical protein
VSKLQPSTVYTFRVRAFNSVGNSSYSNTATAATPANAGAAGLDFSHGFLGASSVLTFNGLPPTINGSALQLTDGDTLEAASAFTTGRVNVTRFATQFSFLILNTTDPSGDGFTFTIQGAGATALGGIGGGLGYGPDTTGGTPGIPASVAVKFDLFSNEGEGFDSTGLYTNGQAPTLPGAIDLGGTGIDLHSQHVFNVAMVYDDATLTVTITDASTSASATESYSVNIPAIVGGGTAYVGFTGGTGELMGKQSILSWTYTPISVAPPAAPSSLTATATSASQVSLSWTANPNNAAAFLIERKTGSAGTYRQIGQTAGQTSFVDLGLVGNTQYFYRVRAINPAGTSGYSSVASVTTPLSFPLGFRGVGSVLTLNGSAKVNGSALQLTDGGMAEAASAFSTNPVNITHFSTQFTFLILNTTNPSADGFTFAIQGVGPTALGASGGALGYGTQIGGGTSGIPNSVAVKFDLFSNQGEGNDSTGLYTNGATPTNVGSIDLTSTGIDLHRQHVFQVSMTYDGTTLQVTITDTSTHAKAMQSYTVSIASNVGGSTAFVGFTGGTGSLTANQSILTWTFTPTAATTAAAPAQRLAATPSGQATAASVTNYTQQSQADKSTGGSGNAASTAGHRGWPLEALVAPSLDMYFPNAARQRPGGD